MFEPINARFASSWLTNGIIDVAMENGWYGETSIKLTSSRETTVGSPPFLTSIFSNVILFFSSNSMAEWTIDATSSSYASIYLTSSDTTPFFTILYGVSIIPNLLTTAYVANLKIRPMFWPSGVSIGHNLP